MKSLRDKKHLTDKISGLSRPVAAATAAAVAIGGLTAVGASPAMAGTASTAAKAADSAKAAATSAHAAVAASPKVPVLRWQACDGGFQCATAQVPLNYQDPTGTTINIAVLRHEATDPKRRVGTLFLNGGGPTQQIVPVVEEFQSLPAILRQRFDIITFDPRGFGFSSALQCFSSVTAENNFFATSPSFPVGAKQDAKVEQTNAKFASICEQKANPNLVAHDSSTDVARDMDLLRQAVGAPELNYYGLSYGTGLGAIYANLFPSKVGHMALDGNLNPGQWTKGGPVPLGLRDGEPQASAADMQALLNLCGATATARCAFSAGTPAATRAKFATLLDRLMRHPVTFGSPSQTVTYADVISDIPLAGVAEWQSGAQRLQQIWVASGDTGPKAPAQRETTAQSRGSAVKQSAGTVSAQGTVLSVYTGPEQSVGQFCADTDEPRALSNWAAAIKLATREGGPFGLSLEWNDEICAAWPAWPGRTGTRVRGTGPPPTRSCSSATPATRAPPIPDQSPWPTSWRTHVCSPSRASVTPSSLTQVPVPPTP